MSAELFQILLNGGGFAVMIWLVAGMRSDQREQIQWMRTIVAGQLEAKSERAEIKRAVEGSNDGSHGSVGVSDTPLATVSGQGPRTTR